MTETEIHELFDRILSLYIQEVKNYYNKPKYTEQINPHTMLGHLWRVMEDTKQRLLNNQLEPAPEICEFTPEEIEMLMRGRA